MKDIIVYRDVCGGIVVSTDGGKTVFEPEPYVWADGEAEEEKFNPEFHRRVWASGPDA